MELKVILEPKTQIEDLSASRASRKPSQSEWVPAVDSLVEKGSSPSEGDLAACASRPPIGAPLDKEKRLAGHSLVVWKRRAKGVRGWKALVCGFQIGDLDHCSLATR